MRRYLAEPLTSIKNLEPVPAYLDETDVAVRSSDRSAPSMSYL